MTLRLMICLLATSAALAQTQTKPTLQTPAERANGQSNQTAPSLQNRQGQAVDLPANAPVITVQGLCPAVTHPATNAAVPSTKECKTIITKEQFAELLKAFNPNNQPVTAAEERKLAESYVDILVYSEAGKSAGVDKTPNFDEVMRVLRLRTLADLYLAQLAEQYKNPSDQELQSYYEANKGKYETFKISRIYIPKNNPDAQAPLEQKQGYPSRASQEANDIQERATKGEPMDQLQKAGYTALGITANPPSVEMNATRPGALPPRLQQEVNSHNAGDVFRLDDVSGYLIYRVEKKEPAPLDSVKKELTQEIYRTKVNDKMKELKAPVHVQLDEGYFGPAPLTNAPPPGATSQPK